MPPPPSGNHPLFDQELINSFTKREKAFYKWYLRTQGTRNKLTTGKWLGRHTDRARYRMSDDEIFNKTMEMSNNPLLVLGTARHGGSITGFAVPPNSTFLWPTWDEARLDYPDEPGLMHESLLVINLNVPVQPTGFPGVFTRLVNRAFVSHNGRSVPDSTQFDPSQTPTNFVFAQLGELCVFVGDWKAARNMSGNGDVDGAWEPTGFGVVVQLVSPSKHP
ncbi:hypothetical protein MRS44_007255 [Fusarium solani]|uniref:uncharacterized protein n=1 Tax=Fusarium solani TaxID=169388 RepID=UPI0032C437C4|nr:hypothetical protein MRS44_007255 [Fusarium solani]